MLQRFLLAIVALPFIYTVTAVALIFSQELPNTADLNSGGRGLDFSHVAQTDLSGLPSPDHFVARDAVQLSFRQYAAARETAVTLILLHGSGWHGMQFHGLAGRISASGAADVLVPDLRGHGPDPVRRGDIDHIGQLEEDLADFIDHVRADNPEKQIVVGGHSSGGGLAVRFAGGEFGAKADGWILLAPFLKYNAPTTRPNSGGWAQPLVRRIIGIGMLNSLGIKAFNNRMVIAFNFPDQVLNGPLGQTATRSYSYRLNLSFAPRDDFQADLAAINRPLLVVAGAEDEAFVAEIYEPVISAQTDYGTYLVIDSENHLGLVDNDLTADAIIDWLGKFDV